MRLLFVISFIGIAMMSCKVNKSSIVKWNTHSFTFFETKDTISLQITHFIENSVFCNSRAIPYALIIGQTEGPTSATIPKKITVLAKCDTNTYVVGQNIKVVSIPNLTTQSTLKPLYITKDTIIANQRYTWPIGSENLAIWGKVL